MIKQRLKQLVITLSIGLSIGTLIAPAPLIAADAFTGDACKGVNALNSDTPSGKCADSKTLNNILSFVINLLSIIVGVVAVIMIIIGGIKYATSAGESSAISSAKSTIIYALVGVIVAALAQVLVHFVLKGVAKSG